MTIRKKFVKSNDVDVFERQNVKQSVENEKYDLKQKVKSLGTECAMLKFEKEEIEIKYEGLEREKITLEDQIEEEYAKNRKLIKDIKNISKDDIEMKKSKLLEKSNKELEENVLMLDNVVQTRDIEIARLRKELASYEATTSNPCENCDDKMIRIIIKI